MLKRGFDIFVSIFAVVILFPFILIIALIIKLGDGGSVFYKAWRVGKDKEPFRMMKFRTMVVNADKIGGPTSLANDPRISLVGKVLRDFKLDEIPQLFNVIAGHMSIVGPRPEIASEVETYDKEMDIIFTVRPGITDLASLRFKNEGQIVAESGIEDPHEAYKTLIQPEKLHLQKEYVQNRSFFLDLKIIFGTIFAVVRR